MHTVTKNMETRSLKTTTRNRKSINSSSESNDGIVVLSPTRSQWNTKYEQLVEFYNENGHSDVPFSVLEQKRYLAKWIARQRQRYFQGTLPEENKLLLDKVAFRFTSKEDKEDTKWMEKYNRLITYRKKHGHTNVPYRNNDDNDSERVLGIWVANQRKMNAAGKLKPQRVKKLARINFQWKLNHITKDATANTTAQNNSAHDKKWHAMYLKLVEYKNLHGDCNVPYNHLNDPSLALWVSTQRRAYHKKTWHSSLEIPTYRVNLLEKLGFQWKISWHSARKPYNNNENNDEKSNESCNENNDENNDEDNSENNSENSNGNVNANSDEINNENYIENCNENNKENSSERNNENSFSIFESIEI